MNHNYDDITSRIKEKPAWYDQNGTPRYGKFTPDQCPDIYSSIVALLLIECQDCGKKFYVEMHTSVFDFRNRIPPNKWHYGDPPSHGCVGDTMNCEDIEVVECWVKNEKRDWKRKKKFEQIIEGN